MQCMPKWLYSRAQIKRCAFTHLMENSSVVQNRWVHVLTKGHLITMSTLRIPTATVIRSTIDCKSTLSRVHKRTDWVRVVRVRDMQFRKKSKLSRENL